MAGAKLVAKVHVTVPENKQSVNIKVSCGPVGSHKKLM